VIFKTNRDTLDSIFEEMIKQYSNKHFINALTKLVYDKPHSFLFINILSSRMFKKWDEIIINEE
jgi:hypothetical protein